MTRAIVSYYGSMLPDGGEKDESAEDKELESPAQTDLDRQMVLRNSCMMERLASSHPFNIENWLRKSCPLPHIQALSKDLKEKGGEVPILEHLRTSSSVELMEYSAGLEMLGQFKNPTLSGPVKIGSLLSFLEGGKWAKTQSCPVCREIPSKPMFAKKVGNYSTAFFSMLLTVRIVRSCLL